MRSKKKIEKNELKVYVTMHNNTRLMGSFYLAEEERLQDLMNDQRAFLPLHVVNINNKKTTIMISKRYIEKVEELHGNEEIPPAPDDRRTGFDRRVNPDRRISEDRRQPVTLQIDPLPSKDSENSESEKNE